jgi:Ca2+-binding RTX toxin-like protein
MRTRNPLILIGKKGDDTLSALAGNDDKAKGGGGSDSLDGGTEDGKLDGGRGENEIPGGDGDDWIKSRGDGGDADNITCGEGEDTVRADRNDVVAADCERVKTAGSNGHGHGNGPGHGEQP